jgi:putative transposase
LLIDHIDLLCDSVRRVRRLHPFHIDAWVVWPDHMRCIWTLPPDTDDFPMRWRLIKLLFSKGLPRYSSARNYAGQARRGDTGMVSYSESWSFHDWVPKLELGNQRNKTL